MKASAEQTSETTEKFSIEDASEMCSHCNCRSLYFAHLENCLHSYCGPCFLEWRRQAFFNFVITCAICGTYSRRAFPSPKKTVNSLSERRKIAESFEKICQRNANSTNQWLLSQCLTLAVLVVAYIAATLICKLFA